MTPTTPSRRAGLSLNDLARQLAPHLRIISASQPIPLLREHNVLGIADDPEVGRRAVLLLEGVEHADDQLGTVVMGPAAAAPTTTRMTGRATSIRKESDVRYFLV